MEAILRVHFGDLEEKLVKQSLAAFYWLRELRGIEKKPSTSGVGGLDPGAGGWRRGPGPHRKGDPLRRCPAEKDKDLQTLRKVK